MALLGIDIGDQSCFVGLALCSGIEILTNDVTDRLTPAIVSFCDKDRQMGSSAKNQMIRNFRNTIFGIKNLLGRDYNDPIVQQEIRTHPFIIGRYPDSAQVAINVNILGVKTWFTPTQIYSMLLRHIVDNAKRTLNTEILSAVISVPSHFTDIQRRAVLDAAKLAGVDMQRLMNDGNALALAYGIYKTDLPEEGQLPRIVAFVDFGYTSFQVNIFAFSIGKALCLSCVSYPNLGGRDFDERLFNYFSTQFNQKYNVNILETKKSCLMLLNECEKLKKLLSANTSSIPINIECLLGEFDFSSKIKRSEFEDLCGDIFLRIQAVLQEAILLSKIDLKDLFSVELVGGSCRIPAVTRLVQTVFCKEVSKTLNFDETVAKGCAVQNALISPTIHVRQFLVVGVIPYTIKINWIDVETGERGEMNAFRDGSLSNICKVLSFLRRFDFQIECNYVNTYGNMHYNSLIAIFKIQNVRPSEDGQASKVKVNLRLDNNGILTISGAELIAKNAIQDERNIHLLLPDNEISGYKKTNSVREFGGENFIYSKNPSLLGISDVNSKEGIPFKQVASESYFTDENEFAEDKLTTGPPNEEIYIERNPEFPLPKNQSGDIRSIVLHVLTDARNMTSAHIDTAIEIERKLISQDRYQTDKVNSKNALEEYVYDMRERLDTTLGDFYREDKKSQFKGELERIYNWLLYDDTKEEPSVYREHLQTLHIMGDPGKIRYIEFQERPIALNKLVESVARLRYLISEFTDGNAEFQNLDAKEIAKVEKLVDKEQSWLEEQLHTHQESSKYTDLTVTAAEICVIDNTLGNIFLSLMSNRIPDTDETSLKEICTCSIATDRSSNTIECIPSQDYQDLIIQKHMDYD